MAKNYFVNLWPANSLRKVCYLRDAACSNSAGHLHAAHEDGLLRNFLHAIFLRPGDRCHLMRQPGVVLNFAGSIG